LNALIWRRNGHCEGVAVSDRLSETAFALGYTAKEADIIPDFVPEIGYADDSLIVHTVLERHQELFHDHCH
jgi:uncharacterized membrane protein YkvA (DUF1232 family)